MKKVVLHVSPWKASGGRGEYCICRWQGLVFEIRRGYHTLADAKKAARQRNAAIQSSRKRVR